MDVSTNASLLRSCGCQKAKDANSTPTFLVADTVGCVQGTTESTNRSAGCGLSNLLDLKYRVWQL